ncbi:MAG: hypothetical protein QF632_03125 [Candidatus Woesearchaeota archaeon]|nr:hypothetical protein [Candidatus Woesearchaeota archaeon]MDP7457842.1 hypothetical protein [Candidatus Woesearchaeota archaeon]
MVIDVNFTYEGKPILPTKAALTELSKIDMDLHEVAFILKQGFQLRKRKKHITEKAIIKGNKIRNVVIIEYEHCCKLIHAGEFSLSRKFKNKVCEKNGSGKPKNEV